jgi:hypothetical protein
MLPVNAQNVIILVDGVINNKGDYSMSIMARLSLVFVRIVNHSTLLPI